MPPGRVVEALDVLANREMRFGPGGIAFVVDPLGLERGEETLSDGIIVAVAGAAHAGDEARGGDCRAVSVAGVGTASVGVLQQASSRATALDGLAERVECECAVVRFARRPADHTPRE